MDHELEQNTWIVCVVCKQKKDKEQFVLDGSRREKNKNIKKYGKICSQCRIKMKRVSKVNLFKKEDDDDEGGSGGKGYRQRIDYYAHMFMLRAQRLRQRAFEAEIMSDRAKVAAEHK